LVNKSVAETDHFPTLLLTLTNPIKVLENCKSGNKSVGKSKNVQKVCKVASVAGWIEKAAFGFDFDGCGCRRGSRK
jgi:hypothetical protein